MAGCGSILICASFFCFFIGGVLFLTRRGQTPPAPAGRPAKRQTRRAAPVKAPPPIVQRPSDSMQDKFANAQLKQTIVATHPQRGIDLTGQITGTIRFTELWQASGSSAWTPTGNTFAAHWLGNWMLYEWQGRVYLLDEAVALSDQDIQQNFMPYAKQFAQSNQTAQVTFAWPPASWTIADIGKFRVARAEGQGLRLNVGAEGRFIHATGADKRALIVEDYQSGSGGQDTAWLGWQITWDMIKRIG